MDNSTPEDLLISGLSSPSGASSQVQQETLQSLHLPADEIPSIQQVMEKLDEINVSPRESSLRAVFEYAKNRKKQETVH